MREEGRARDESSNEIRVGLDQMGKETRGGGGPAEGKEGKRNVLCRYGRRFHSAT